MLIVLCTALKKCQICELLRKRNHENKIKVMLHKKSRNMIKRTMYQCKVDVDMLNAIKSVLADVSSISPWSEQRDMIYGIHSNLKGKHCK